MYMIYSLNNIYISLDIYIYIYLYIYTRYCVRLYVQVISGGSLKINVPVQFTFLENLYEKLRI